MSAVTTAAPSLLEPATSRVRRLSPGGDCPLRGRARHVRAALQHAGDPAGARRAASTSPRRESTLTLSLTTVAGRRAPGRRPALGRDRPDPADPLLDVLSVAVRDRLCVGADLAALLVMRLLEGVALAGLPAVATAYLREELHASTHGPRRRPLHRRHRAGRHGRATGHRLHGRARRLALVARCRGFVRSRLRPRRTPPAARLAPLLPRPDRRARHARHGPAGRRGPDAGGALRHRRLLGRRPGGGAQRGRVPSRGAALRARTRRRQPGLPRLPLGTVSAARSGRLADRIGRRPCCRSGASWPSRAPY